MPTKGQMRVLPPMVTMQYLNDAVDEFVDAVEKLRNKFPNLTTERASDIVLQLKSMCIPREVR